MLDLAKIREDFPILNRQVNGRELVYLDSANTSQKPTQVIEAMKEFSLTSNANVARAMHTLGTEASLAYETARGKVADFIGAQSQEIIFTKNASEALNLAAYTLGSSLTAGDEVVISVAEHHSNIVPWQMACERTGATLRWFDVDDTGELDLDKAHEDHLINESTKVVALTAMSNVTGVRFPLTEVASWAHDMGAVVVADGSQLVGHEPVDVGNLGADFMAFTGHKMLGPTGIGVLWGHYEHLESLPPFLGGGEMIEVVTMDSSTYAKPPYRFEAGTPAITQAVGLGAAVDYLDSVGMDAVAAHTSAITTYALSRLGDCEQVRILGPRLGDRGCPLSFEVGDIHPHDVMQVLDSLGVAIRGGHHCARPLHVRLGVQSSVRASSYLYTTTSDIDALIDGVGEAWQFFGGNRG
ncbi:MAG: SufS family cysteine desulfurase [Propionibacteriaceae bacterium]|nr:SufS family cysteine desulfurase [Propionibacteriaceae bacterium]